MNKIKILGAKISCIASYDEAYLELANLIKIGSPEYITVNNVHTITQSVLENDYRNVLNNSVLSLPDGKPLSIIAKLKGEKNISRIFGPTFFEKTLEWGQKEELKHYFFGSSNETLLKMLNTIKHRYSSTLIAGSFTPPYRVFTSQENESFIKQMNESGADIFWIGLGAPKQEIWIYENYKKLNRGVMIGIGAGFDYIAGNTKHAPEWMKNMSLEWLFRLVQEPKRLWKRYLVSNTLFLFFITLEFLHLKKFNN